MGFIYGKEKRRFDAEWRRLAEEYREAGFDEAGIRAMRDFDWQVFCRRRTYENNNQALPSEVINNDDDGSRSALFRKFSSLTVSFDESAFGGRYDWIESIDNPVLAERLAKLFDDDKEILTLFVIDGYTQKEISEILHCVQSTISKKLAQIKKILL